jgi:heavy metal sensor kinase
MNIRLRLTLWYMAVLFLILVIFSAAVYLGLSQSLFLTLDTHIKREVGQLIGGLKFHHDEERSEDESEDDEKDSRRAEKIELGYWPEEGVLWRILDTEGHLLIDSGRLTGAPIDPVVAQIEQARFDYTSLADGTPIKLYSAPFVIERRFEGVVQLGESYRHIQEVQRQLILLFAIGVPFTILAASAGGWFLAASALNPIDRISRAAQQISADDLHQRLNLNLPNDEVGRLAVTFDQMLARLDEAFERQKRFIADASHEMRTPLTILKGDVEVALNRPRSTDEYQETLKMVNQTTDHLATLVEELFLLARADSDQYPVQLCPLNLAEVLNDTVGKMLPQAVSKNISLNLAVPKRLPLVADRDKLARLFMNLLDNAVKYSRTGDSINITATVKDGHACITVADTGPGIPAEHLPHLFERFYRVDQARSHSGADSGSGAGLGLSIVQWLVKVHGGRIEVASRVGEGTNFTVWLPLEHTSTSA